MSSRRKTYDGNIFGGSFGLAEWGDTHNNQVENDKHASSKRTTRVNSRLSFEDSFSEDDGEKDRYLITYADLITLLLGLFIILYAISSIDLQKYDSYTAALGSVFGKENKLTDFEDSNLGITDRFNGMRTWKSTVNELIEINGLSDGVELIETDKGLTLRIMDKILFNSGEAELNENAKVVLKQIAQVLSELPNEIRIEGHSDNVPISTPEYPSNWHLSVARATNTAHFLLNIEGITPDKLSIAGFAAYEPIKPNDTAEGRAKNRRVDIVILKQQH
jgi:chemotaxis protein MotB